MPTARPATPPMASADADLRRGDAEVARRSRRCRAGATDRAPDRRKRRHDVAEQQSRRRQRFPRGERRRRRSRSRSAATRARVAAARSRCHVPGRSHRSIRSVTSKNTIAGQDHEQDRAVGAGQVVALGELVDELAEAAEVDQELDADDVDHREDEPEPQADEDRRQRRRQQDLAELLRRRELEAAADVDQHLPRAGEPFDRLQDHRRQAGGEADHHDRRRAAAEDHEEERIHEHDRRGGQRADPGLAGQRAASGTGRAGRRAAMPTTASSRLAHSTSCVVCQKRCSTCSSTTMRGIAARICDGSGTMNGLMTPARIRSSTSAIASQRRRDADARAPRRGDRATRRDRHRRASAGAARAIRRRAMPRLASSRRSCQISAT